MIIFINLQLLSKVKLKIMHILFYFILTSFNRKHLENFENDEKQLYKNVLRNTLNKIFLKIETIRTNTFLLNKTCAINR